jgi:hypothetical protein
MKVVIRALPLLYFHLNKTTVGMEKQLKNFSRKKFLSWGLGITSFFALPAFFRFSKKKKEAQKVKMLTQDGRLVEVNVANIPEKKKEISETDIHTWINKKPTF